MDSGLDPLAGMAISLIILLMQAAVSAFNSAVNSSAAPDKDTGEDSKSSAAAREEIIDSLRDDPAALRRTFWFINILTCLGAYLFAVCLPLPVWAGILVYAALVYIAGLSLPFLLGRKSSIKMACRLYPVWKVLAAAAAPFTAVLGVISTALARLFGVRQAHLEDRITEEEILQVVNEGHEKGVVDEDEAEMIANIFEFDDKQAQDIMTHRGSIEAIEASTSLQDAIAYMVGAPNSRFPVYEENIDTIIGVLYLKDAVRFQMEGEFSGLCVRDVEGLIRDVRFIPQTMAIDELFRQMQDSRQQLAVVVDEYGETAGIVTMEDILEEIVGNLYDEYDKKEVLVVRLPDGNWKFNAMIGFDEAQEIMDITLQGDYETLNGYLTARLGHIPVQDDRDAEIRDDQAGIVFRILSVGEATVDWVEADRMKKSESPQEETDAG